MRDKVEGLIEATRLSMDNIGSPASAGRSSKSEALEALQTLGYRPVDAENMIRQAEQGADADISASALIKKALQASVSR
jgi:Holliday junction resolvasome RuvABC DNA-binding subunit